MLTKLEQIQRASLNASLAAIMERLEKFADLDERLRNVEDGLLLLLNANKPEPKPKPKKQVKEKKEE